MSHISDYKENTNGRKRSVWMLTIVALGGFALCLILMLPQGVELDTQHHQPHTAAPTPTGTTVNAGPKEIVQVTEANLPHVVNGTHDVLLEIYAEWCPHCTAFAPAYKRASELIYSTPKLEGVVVAKSSVVSSPGVASKYNVRGYPTMLWIPRDKADAFTTVRSRVPEEILKYVQEHVSQDNH